MSGFKKAVRQASKLRLALIGPAGSGKTFTALRVAARLGGRVALIDTEHASASKYAPPEGESADPANGTFEFECLALTNFDPREYVKAIRLAEQKGFDVLIIDSLSHAWVGQGGALEMHDTAVERQRGSKNSYTAWREVTPHHLALVESMLQSRTHIIATVRAKTEYVQEKDANGKTTVRKVGLAPVQRDGLEYEFDVVGDLDVDNKLVISKTRCPALRAKVIPCPGEEFADTLRSWLAIGKEPPAPTADLLARFGAADSAAALDVLAKEISALKDRLQPADLDLLKKAYATSKARIVLTQPVPSKNGH